MPQGGADKTGFFIPTESTMAPPGDTKNQAPLEIEWDYDYDFVRCHATGRNPGITANGKHDPGAVNPNANGWQTTYGTALPRLEAPAQ